MAITQTAPQITFSPTPDTTSARPERLPATVWLLGAVAFLMGTTELIVAGLLPQMAAALQVSIAQAGLLITVFAVGMLIGAPLMALLTLRLPRKATLVLALLVFAGAHIAAALTTSFGVILVARFLAAVGTGTFWAIGAVVAADAAGAQAGARAMGIMIGGVTMANIVGVPVGTAAGQALGWQGPFWGLALLAGASALLLARKLPSYGARREAADLRSELGSLAKRRLWVVYVATALLQASFVAVYSYVAPLLTDRAGLAEGVVPLVMAGYGVGALAGTTLGGRLGDRRPFTVLVPASVLLTLTLVALLLWGSNSLVAIVLFVLLGFFGLVGNPVLVAEVVRVGGISHALPMALSTSWFNVGIATGSWLGGVAISSSYGVQGPPVIGLAIAAVALLPITALALTAGRLQGRHQGVSRDLNRL